MSEPDNDITSLVFKVLEDREKRMEAARYRHIAKQRCSNCENGWINEFDHLECMEFGKTSAVNVCDMWRLMNEA